MTGIGRKSAFDLSMRQATHEPELEKGELMLIDAATSTATGQPFAGSIRNY